MSAFEVDDRVGDIVVRRPALSRAFERAGIDYCCGGRKTLDEACREKGLDSKAFAAELERAISPDGEEAVVDVAAMSLSELVDHLERTHHVYLRSEFSRLDGMSQKVVSVHGEKDSRLQQVREVFLGLADELTGHMQKEEQILFPMVRQLEASKNAPVFHCGTLANPIQRMQFEHDETGSALEKLRELTDGYTPPEWACGTYRGLLDGLAHLEWDTHQHIHKENNVLFPRALDMEARKSPAPRGA